MDNELIEGDCLKHLRKYTSAEAEEIDSVSSSPPPLACTLKCLVAGTFNLQVQIDELLANIVQSPAALKRSLASLELTGYIGRPLHQLIQLDQLGELTLNFYIHNHDAQATSMHQQYPQSFCLLPIVELRSLRKLVLNQEYCHEEFSLVDDSVLCPILRACSLLERLEISGDFAWKLRLSNRFLLVLAQSLVNLRELKLNGYCPKITDFGVIQLAQLGRLERLTLNSLNCITDSCILKLLTCLPKLSFLHLHDNGKLTKLVVRGCCRHAREHPRKLLTVFIDEEQFPKWNRFYKTLSESFDSLWSTWRWKCKSTSDQSKSKASGYFSLYKNLLANEDASVPLDADENEMETLKFVEGLPELDSVQYGTPSWPQNLQILYDDDKLR